MTDDLWLLLLFIFIVIPFAAIGFLGFLETISPELMDFIISTLDQRLNRRK